MGVKKLSITYNALNKDRTFSAGDLVTGRVKLKLDKNTTVKHVFVKLRGDAVVCWSSRDRTLHRSYKRYFKLKQFLIPESIFTTVLPKGKHAYDFSFNIPVENVPPSFKGMYGQIVYMLEAKVTRETIGFESVVSQELTFVHRSTPRSIISPLVGLVGKELGTNSFEEWVQMKASVDRSTCCPGDKMTVEAKVNNSSSKESLKLKFKLVQSVVYRANGQTICSKEVCSAVGKTVKPNTSKTITSQLLIPKGQTQTIDNCDIISLHYHLEACFELDIDSAVDPEVKFHVVVLPAGFKPVPPVRADSPPPYQPQCFGRPTRNDIPPPYQPQGFGEPADSDSDLSCSRPFQESNRDPLPQQTSTSPGVPAYRPPRPPNAPHVLYPPSAAPGVPENHPPPNVPLVVNPTSINSDYMRLKGYVKDWMIRNRDRMERRR